MKSAMLSCSMSPLIASRQRLFGKRKFQPHLSDVNVTVTLASSLFCEVFRLLNCVSVVLVTVSQIWQSLMAFSLTFQIRLLYMPIFAPLRSASYKLHYASTSRAFRLRAVSISPLSVCTYLLTHH